MTAAITYANYFHIAALPDGTVVLTCNLGEDEQVAKIVMTQQNARLLAKLITEVLEEHNAGDAKPLNS